jgi:hypothetical protein
MAGVIELELDIRVQIIGHGQMAHFIDTLVERRRKIEIARVQLDL